MTREPDKYVFLIKPSCPRCGCWNKLRTTRSVRDQGDGSTSRRTVCLRCLWSFTIIWDPPNIGGMGEADE